MVFDVSVALTWLLFLALFPIAYFWFRRAWRIIVKRDFADVCLKRGVPPPHPEKYAPWAGALNLLAGAILVTVIFGIVTGDMSYETWSALAGSTLWMKILLDFALSRHAHLVVKGWDGKPRDEPVADSAPESEAETSTDPKPAAAADAKTH